MTLPIPPTFDAAEARKVCEAATEGPWEHDQVIHATELIADVVRTPHGWLADVEHGDYATTDWNPADAKFVAYARSALPAALDRVEELEAEVKRLSLDEATMKLSRMIGLGDPVRPDIHAKAVRQRDTALSRIAALEQECERLRGLVEEACGVAEEGFSRGWDPLDRREHHESIARIRFAAIKGGK